MDLEQVLKDLLEFLDELKYQDEKKVLRYSAEYNGEFDGEDWNTQLPSGFVEITGRIPSTEYQDGTNDLTTVTFNIYAGSMSDGTMDNPLAICDEIWKQLSGMQIRYGNRLWVARLVAQNLYSRDKSQKAYILQGELVS